MNSSITYRLARSGDWPAIRLLLQSCDLPLHGAADCLDTFLVVIIDAEIVGCAAFERHGDAALFRSCAVASGHRGKGLGAALTTRAIALATDLGVRQLVLLTLTAEKYFPRFGFSRIARDEVPASIKESREFRDACPASAVVMIRMPQPALQHKSPALTGHSGHFMAKNRTNAGV